MNLIKNEVLLVHKFEPHQISNPSFPIFCIGSEVAANQQVEKDDDDALERLDALMRTRHRFVSESGV
jgi:hypothetical protein